MSIPEVNLKELIHELQHGETMQFTESDKDIPGDPITSSMKTQLSDLARAFEVFSYDLAPDNESKKFSDLLLYIKKSIY